MQLVLIRGLPGSGKSTLARSLGGFSHYEADMYFVNEEGEYNYNPAEIKMAHEWCQHRTWCALTRNENVVVSNTFTRLWEMDVYIDMGKFFRITPLIVEAKGNWPSIHAVPEAAMASMRQRWEPLP